MDVSVPLRAGKKMKKRKELDALATAASRRPQQQPAPSSRDQLLSESTDEREEYWAAKVRGGGGGGGGGSGGGGGHHHHRRLLLRRRACGSLLRACAAVLVFACVVATTTVMWLFIDVREQVAALRTQLDQVVAGSQGVPDALQKCHSVSKDLQENQTAIFKRIAILTQELENFTAQLTAVQQSLRSVEDQLKAAPELVSVPKDLQEVKNSVASFGSQIRDLDTRVSSAKDQSGKLQDVSKGLLQNITSLESRVDLLANHSQQLQPSPQDKDTQKAMLATINDLVRNLSSVNSTLSNKIQWTTDDQHHDNTVIQTLRDSAQNVSARLSTLEGKCADFTSDKAAIESTITRLIAQSNDSVNHWQELSSQLWQVKSQYNELAENVTEVRNMLDNIHQVESFQLHHSPAVRLPDAAFHDGVSVEDDLESTIKNYSRH
ncbi:structural maintenance of chromosomes protein 6 isoform X2 [Bacillus rossius redtenbacheri]|uniref:structural maintenance of chromosomes protein 6 isoform X2 n=1 Tax=Bacillus rossius redtenbacheri TaxID=93214 RepID=UPI002FDDC1BF